ncbi:36188_t:CDS:10, partial [Racocetra persica]
FPVVSYLRWTMGNNISSTTASIATAGIDSYVSELGDIEYERSLSSARFMKTICGRHKEGLVVIKIFIKPEPGLSLVNVVKSLQDEKDALSEVPNAFPYQRIIETEKAGYLIRHTRPFLNCIEKKWITYQILCGVHDAHTRGIYHGDIKTENILVTSWNWVYLADFAGYKPTYLPEDNPADFSFFFDTSSRRTCYLAPERFYKPGSEIDRRKSELEFGEKDGAITPAMDIFSLGCVIAELFLEGTPIFSLAQLFEYRAGEYDPGVYLEKIEDAEIRAMVRHMIHVEPSQRYTAEQYLHEWRGTAFPQYFYTFLHQYIGSVTDPHNQAHPRTLATNGTSKADEPQDSNITTSTVINTDADDKIERIYYEFDKIAFFLGFYNENVQDTEVVVNNSHSDKVGESSRPIEVSSPNATPALTVNLHIPNYDYFSFKNKKRRKDADDGALIFLSLICATIRNAAYPSSKLHALDMLLAIGQHLEDEFKLDRLVPYLIALLGDEIGLVRANAVKTLAHLISAVDTITPSNATIFPEYIMPNLRKFATDPEILVRMTYAQCISTFAETALRFLELTQAKDYLNVADNDAEIERSYEATYDATLHDLQSIIQEQVTTLLIDTESAVKRALLSNITSLCIFFGRQKANDVLLSHMITYLNDRDSMLRSIIGVGTFVGRQSLEEYILPLMIQSLSDAEEFVVEKVLNSLTSLAELGLFQKMKLWELIAIVLPLMCHPGIYIRYEGLVVIKIFIKPEPGLSLVNVVKSLQDEKDALSEVPNAFPYQRIIETEKAGYLIRHTRPFLNCIEKKWITYQILCGVHDAHTRGIYHGDIKTENILVTSWNWVYLADFAGYKPTYLPEDNPADFSFFFDTSSRRTCYLAPERFYKPGSEIDRRKSELEFGEKDGAITPAMDIFSLGCVIAELFLEGTPIFSLAQLFEYRAGEYDPGVYLEKIEDAEIRAMVRHMIHVEPSQRYTAEQYLHEWRGTAFPQYFYTFLHQYIGSVTDPHNQAHPRTLATNGTSKADEPQDSNITTSTVINTDADDKIERIYYEFDKIAFFLGFYNENVQDTEVVVNNSHSDKVGESSRPIEVSSPNATPALTVNLHIPNYDYFSFKNKKRRKDADDGALIFLSLICATIRNAAYPSSKLHALDMLLAIGQHLEDEFKLDRLVPYLIALLGDEIGLVRANAVKTLAHLISAVDTITPSNATIFPEYIMPNLRKFATDPEILVRMTYAQCISTFAETALRFLELTQAKDYLNVADNDAEIERSYEATYDATLHDLQSIIQEQVTTLLIDTESAVKRALLSNITSLCIFFGRQKANDVLLSHMITYLNDRDSMLRSIIGVGTFVGRQSLEEYILPLMIQSLSDAEEFVVEKVLNSLTSLAELGLFQKMKLWELIAIVLPLMCHPGIYIRYGTIAFIASAARLLPTTDVWCIAYPIIRPFLQADIAEVTELHILENVKEPIPRPVFDKAVSWAGKSNKSSFWKQAKERKANKSASTTVSGNSSVTSLLSRRTSALTINAGKILKSE